MPENFDPRPHLMKYKGRDYLEAKWRLVWLRAEHPDARIVTELIERGDKAALFRACVTLPSGGSATGWGSETQDDFGDFLEKAETKALGRALAALGYGTQFAVELDEGDSVADSPVERKQPPPIARDLSGKPEPKPLVAKTTAPPIGPSDERKALNKALLAAMAGKNQTQSQVAKVIQDLYGAVRTGDLSDQQLADVIGWVEDRLELRYTASGTAVLMPIMPAEPGTLAVESMPFEVTAAGT